MRTDQLIRHDGMLALRERLGIVEAERFIALIGREPFDYTEWQQGIWQDRTVDQVFDAASTASSSLEQ